MRLCACEFQDRVIGARGCAVELRRYVRIASLCARPVEPQQSIVAWSPVQGDVLVSEALATIFARQADRDGGPNRMAACFIHQVPLPCSCLVSRCRNHV